MNAYSKSRQASNVTMAFTLASVVLGMVILAYASVPLYKLFCQITGFGGTPKILGQQETANAPVPGYRTVQIHFNADTSPDLPWEFQAPGDLPRLRLGETATSVYRVRNLSKQAVTGTSTYNVTPHKTGPYVIKVECFCFTEQTIGPGETVEMPVTFMIDPAIADEKSQQDIKSITLSYTFFLADS